MLDLDNKFFKFFFVFLFLTQFSFGQLSNFTLNVTHTDETCTANGSLSFNVTNTTVGATIVYSIYHLPDTTTPISVQNTTTFTGLVAGNYSVVATQSLGNLSNSQQQNVTIISQIVLLTYNLTGNNEICGNDGTITVNVTTGIAVQYEIFAGPIIKPLQPSNVFTGLVAGQYSVRVFDACGEGVVQNFTIYNQQVGLIIDYQNTFPQDCNNVKVQLIIRQAIGQVIAFPINIEFKVFPPSGGTPIVFNQVINSATFNNNIFQVFQLIPLFVNQVYFYNIKIVDHCGTIYNDTNNLVYSSITPRYTLFNSGCAASSATIYLIQSAVLVSAPSTYTFTVPFNFSSLIDVSSNTLSLLNLPNGTYTFQVTNLCGESSILLVIIAPPDAQTPFVNVTEGCEIGFGSVAIYGQFQEIQITSAPSIFTATLPLNVSNYISTSSFDIGFLPIGSYVFYVKDLCGNEFNLTIVIEGYHEINNISILENCGSFDINLHHSSNNMINDRYWLQKYYPLANQWGNPITGVYVSGDISNTNAISLNNNTINYNFGVLGDFRIIKVFNGVSGNGAQNITCMSVLKEFTFTGLPQIKDVYSFSCSNGTYDVFVDAVGVQPLIYRITQKNGLPFVIQNANSSVFLGLPAAIYNFQVEDACGSILNSVFEVPKPFNLAITPIGFCEGEPSSLTMPNFSIFQYQWWKDNATTTILSTTNTLAFSTFNSATDAGVYHVRVRYTGNPNSCIDFVLDYTISANAYNPNAGLDGAVTYCGNQGIINLFTLLQGNYDSGGSWQETTTSGTLSANLWNSATVIPGNYQFQYHVDGLCDSFDDAVVNITINSIPQTPLASVDPIVCNTQNLNLFATTIPNATYSWTGPNGFASNEQNPIINAISSNNNGTYTVSVADNGCVSETSSVNVSVGLLPDFILESYCENSDYKVSGTPINASYSYNWTGPNGFSSADNPIVISNGSTGLYNLTITTSEGCSASKSIPILTTLCYIPNVITPNDDGFDDFLNLAGFDVEKIQIFSRWGRLVYEKENYINEWYGQNNNDNLLPESTYYYFVKLRSGEEKHGWIFVVKS